MGKEKKEIGKLLELLNEYEPFICGDGTYTDNHWGYVLDGHSAVYPKSVAKNVIISKSYGFIKWLVENDKIDEGKVKKEAEYYWTDEYDVYVGYVFYHRLLMLLAIQEQPIRFLCEILK